MCKACYSDPAWDEIHYRRQGAVPIEDFDDEVRYRKPGRKTNRSRPRSATRTPCPVAEDGKHVWVWEPYESEWSGNDRVFRRVFGYYKRERQTCCGCMATKGMGRDTERYMRVKERKWRNLTGGEYAVERGAPVNRWGRRWGRNFYSFVWENDDERFVKAMAEWEQTKEAKRIEEQKWLRRMELRRKYFGL